MPLTETLITLVAPAITKTLLRVWVGHEKVALEAGSSAIDILTKLVPDIRARKETQRQLDAIGERAAQSLQFVFETEGKAIFADEQDEVAKLVAEMLDSASISVELIVAKDLDPVKLAEHLLSESHEKFGELTPARAELVRRVIADASQSIVDIASKLPNFGERTLGELLRQNRVLIDAASQILDKLEQIRSKAQIGQEIEAARFETEYRRAVARNLNKMELFGVDLSQTSRSQPLTVAYVSLQVGRSEVGSEEDEDDNAIRDVETALANNKRILIKGPAGAGKTTLLRWIAVRAANREFESPLENWNDVLPFVVRLRQFSSSAFPSPEQFPSLVASTIAGTMPGGWVHEKLASGRVVLMIDGVDEVTETRREAVRNWVNELTATFPDATFIVTSRPYAVEEDWLKGNDFGEAILQPMDTSSVEEFVDHWHRAVAKELQEESDVARLGELSVKLKDKLRNNRSVRRLATNPLLCGVICALHRDTNEQLPEDRIELYEHCCSMLLERRDPESGLELSGYPKLSYRQKRTLLDDLAYWMVKNEWTEVSWDSVEERLGKKLANLQTARRPPWRFTPRKVLNYFLERSGMLREPIEKKIDFAHRTFQEYMAAKAAVDEGDIGVLADHASNPQWREVIVLGSGQARPDERRQLITTLLKKGDEDSDRRYQLHLLAAACVETAVDLDPEVKAQVEQRVERLVPPNGMQRATFLAEAAGDIAVPFLRKTRNLYAREAAACVRALSLIGSDEALQAIAEYARDNKVTVLKEVARSADRFEEEQFSRLVLPALDVALLPEDLTGRLFMRFGAQSLRGTVSIRELNLKRPPLHILHDLHKLPALRRLSLSGLNPEGVAVVEELTLLESLELAIDEVLDLSLLRTLKNLKSLHLNGHSVQDLSPLGDLKNLQHLGVWSTNVVDISPVRTLENLSSFTLSGVGVQDLSPLRALKNLKELMLWLDEVDLSPLSGLDNLRSLSLGGRRTDISPLQGLSNLSRLYLSELNFEDIPTLKRLPNLKVLELGLGPIGLVNDPLESLRAANPTLYIRP